MSPKIKIGILGGIGPEATAEFYSKLIYTLQKEKLIKSNKDYPQIIINSIPAPELIYEKILKEDLKPYIEGLKELDKFNPDFIVMVCNTIHLYYERLQKEVKTPIIDLRKEVKEYLIKNKIKSRLDIFASLTFEDVSRSFVKIGLKKGIMFNKVGRWWSKDSEIDIVAINDDENSILFGEAKWSTKKVGTDILTDLKRKSSMVEWGKKNRKEYYALFSRKGFTEEVKMIAEKEGVFLIGVEEINI